VNTDIAIWIGAWIVASPFIFLFILNSIAYFKVWRTYNRSLNWSETVEFWGVTIRFFGKGVLYWLIAAAIIFIGYVLVDDEIFPLW
jgi:hypothetical protein